jgi:replicative DNA helicase
MISAEVMAERMLAVCVLQRPEACAEVRGLSPEALQDARARAVFAAAMALWADGDTPTVTGVHAALQARGQAAMLGGLSGLLAFVHEHEPATPHEAAALAERVRAQWARRGLATLAAQLAAYAAEIEPAHPVRPLEAVLADVADAVQRAQGAVAAPDRVVSMQAALTGHIDTLGRRLKADPRNAPILTGMPELDRCLHGVSPGQLLVLAALPGTGKTRFGAWWALQAARAGVGVLYEALEMTRDEILDLLHGLENGIPTSVLQYGEPDPTQWRRLMEGLNTMSPLPIAWAEGACTVAQIRADIQRARAIGVDARLCVVNQLELLDVAHEEREDLRWKRCMRQLKSLAVQERVAIIVEHQVSRRAETRAGGVPLVTDLAESAGLERRADKIVFLARPGRSDPDVPPDALHVIVAKHRMGAEGSLWLTVDLPTGRLLPGRASASRAEARA